MPAGETYRGRSAEGRVRRLRRRRRHNKPYRCKIRAPGFAFLQAIGLPVKGHMLADWSPSSDPWISCSGRSIDEPNNRQHLRFSREPWRSLTSHIAKYPEGRQASAVLPLLDMAQRQATAGCRARQWIISPTCWIWRRSASTKSSRFTDVSRYAGRQSMSPRLHDNAMLACAAVRRLSRPAKTQWAARSGKHRRWARFAAVKLNASALASMRRWSGSMTIITKTSIRKCPQAYRGLPQGRTPGTWTSDRPSDIGARRWTDHA